MSKKLLRFKMVLVVMLILIGFIVVHAEEKKSDSSLGKTVSGAVGAAVGGVVGYVACVRGGKIAQQACSSAGSVAGQKVGETVWEKGRTIVEKVKDAVSEYGQRRAKEDAENPWRHKD